MTKPRKLEQLVAFSLIARICVLKLHSLQTDGQGRRGRGGEPLEWPGGEGGGGGEKEEEEKDGPCRQREPFSITIIQFQTESYTHTHSQHTQPHTTHTDFPV